MGLFSPTVDKRVVTTPLYLFFWCYGKLFSAVLNRDFGAQDKPGLNCIFQLFVVAFITVSSYKFT